MNRLTRIDYWWSYLAQILAICSGIITLPLILKFLSSDEIGLNYVLMSVSALIALFDFGFSAQFSRNFAYVFAGAQNILQKGIDTYKEDDFTGEINYVLLKTLIQTAKQLYSRLSIFVLLILLTIGSLYIYKVTDGFVLVKNSFFIWLLFSFSVAFDFYYKYYTPLLLGKGLIVESKKIQIYSVLIRLFFILILLLCGYGLWSVIIGSFIGTILNRILSIKYFNADGINKVFDSIIIEKRFIKDTFNKIWYNAKRLGIVSIATYTSMQLGLFYSGLFLSLADVASYGLMLQLVTLIVTISSVAFNTSIPIMSMQRTQGNLVFVFQEFTFTMGMFYLLYIIGSLSLILLGPFILSLLKANAQLPSIDIIIVFCIFKFLEAHHCNCSVCLATKNVVYDFHSATILGILNSIFLYVILKYTSLGIWGIILTQGIIGLLYPNWKWPYEICKEFKIGIFRLVYISFYELYKRIKI